MITGPSYVLDLKSGRKIKRKDGFFDEKRQKHLFKFDVTNFINDNEDNSKNNIKYARTKSIFGGIVAISVYFHIAEEVERLDNYVKNQVEKVQVQPSRNK
ncbi:unnamed protein product [Rhizophagus irregularis]|uniref:Uncharacterized protein n=1 Tax=Rhizophagus irregularis TaxID=588596 RepID=A0A915ZVQ5_9GLOM|nr:unnamed protein product [Rhizophagus irregularis]CAB5389201.1 unnamed protein product [Rhizophagus irregularis]